MSPQESQERGITGGPAEATGRSLRNIPGFTVALVAFVMIVILGVGGIAVAKWSQTATVTMGVTAGAAPTTAPAPTVPPTTVPPTTAPTAPPSTTPPAAPGPNTLLVVSRPKTETRPASASAVECRALNGQSGKVTITWSGATGPGITYALSLTSQTSRVAYQQDFPNVVANSAVFELDNKEPSHGYYLLRIIPTKDGVAGDPYYQRLRFFANGVACDDGYNQWNAAKDFTVTAERDPAVGNGFTVLNVKVATTAPATRYKVSIQSNSSSYGADVTFISSLSSTITFPATTAAYGQYTLRIQSMTGTEGTVAGDSVYKTVQYGNYTLNSW